MRIPSLDGIRAFSILLVLLAHLSGTRHFVRFEVLEAYGNVGVRIFFVISGYLITTLLLTEYERTGGISFSEFYRRRAYRILPAAYAYMLFMIALNWRVLRPATALAALTYTSNFVHGGLWSFGHLWSLSVEEQFYLLWPLSLVFFFQSRRALLLGAIAAGPPLRVLFWLLWGHRGLEHPFPVVMDALAMGCLLAIAHPEMERWKTFLASRWFVLIPVATMLIPITQFFSNRLYLVVGLTALHLGIALSIDHVIRRRYVLLNAAPIVWLGVISYSLYLWQQPFLDRNSAAPWNAFPVNLGFAVLLACLSHYCVEKPFLAARERRRIAGPRRGELLLGSNLRGQDLKKAG
jgi:peptidoglycan/LPS O-acetylase OafA/YrhL